MNVKFHAPALNFCDAITGNKLMFAGLKNK